MSSRRRRQLLAATAAGLLLAAILAGVLANATGSSSSNTISVPAAHIPSTPTDPHAQDRAQITALALAYQQALAQTTHTNPCNYLDPQSRIAAMKKANTGYPGGPEACSIAAQDMSSNAGLLSPPGINESTVQFGQPAQQVRCVDAYSPPTSLPPSQRGLSWAVAGWAGANGLQVTFVKEDDRWWVDLLLCHA